MDRLGGWEDSAEAWIAFQDEGDPNRIHVLDPVMLELCGDTSGKAVLDLGCGEGRLLRMLAGDSSERVGLDPSPPLLRAANARAGGARFVRAFAESLPFRSESFDLVVSYISLVDICDTRSALREACRVLKPGGHLVLSNLQSWVTSGSGWTRDEEGRRLCFVVDEYYQEKSRVEAWRGIEVVQYHRPFEWILAPLFESNMCMTAFREPVPSSDTLFAHPELDDYLRVPYFYAMRWDKPA